MGSLWVARNSPKIGGLKNEERGHSDGMTRLTATLPAGVFEREGKLFMAKPGAKSTFEDYVAARATFIEIHTDARWNPWVRDDRAQENDAAMAVMEQWTRAEPGFRQMTDQELEEKLAETDRVSRAKFAADKARQERDKKRYDPEREHARLQLLEQESILIRRNQEIDELRAGRYSAWTDERRAAEVAELEAGIAGCDDEIQRFSSIVGNREDVVDQYGRLPRDRREVSLFYYQLHREQGVRELRQQLPELKAGLKESKDKAELSKLRLEIQTVERKLEKFLAVPPLTADDMCSECARPASEHGWVTPPFEGPCPAWPGWGARIAKARAMLFEAGGSAKAKEPEPPKPQPIAVVPSGLPVADVIAKLTELQAAHPDAVVKRGRANRWEMWPAD